MTKGEQTRERIVERAFRLACVDGLAGLSLGRLASELSLSKSGLFAHFGSKEGLELEVLRVATERFLESVVRPALAAPRGLPRLRQLFVNWLGWIDDPERPGGCVFLAAAVELDDSAGPQRDLLAGYQSAWLATLAKAVRLSVEEGQLRADLDCEQFAFEMLGIAHAYHHLRRLLHDPKAESRARAAFEARLQAARAA